MRDCLLLQTCDQVTCLIVCYYQHVINFLDEPESINHYELRMHPGIESVVDPDPMTDEWVLQTNSQNKYFTLDFVFDLLTHREYRYLAVMSNNSEPCALISVEVYAQGMFTNLLLLIFHPGIFAGGKLLAKAIG